MFDVSLSTRREKVSGIVNITKMASHAALQRVLVECLEIGQMITATFPQFLITNSHKLDTTIGFLLQKHHAATERVQEFSPFGAAASSNGALPTPSRLSEHFLYCLVTWNKNMNIADNAHNTSPVTLGRIIIRVVSITWWLNFAPGRWR